MTGASGWGEAYLDDAQLAARRQAWIGEHRPALDLALEHFLYSAEWPERERFRRQLVQQGLTDIDLEELLGSMQRPP